MATDVYRIQKKTDPEKKAGFIECFAGKYALLSNETEMYDLYILKYNQGTLDIWIAKDKDELSEHEITIIRKTVMRYFL